MKGDTKTPYSGVIQSLNFNDSDEGEMEMCWNISMESNHSPETPDRRTSTCSRSSGCDSGLGTPTPVSLYSRMSRCKSPAKAPLSPIPFNVGDSDEDQLSSLPTAIFTPPHKKFGSLRLHDTPQTPKSLLQRSQRRIITRPRNSKGKHKDFDRPETNINPFTPNNNPGVSKPNHSTLKRSRYSMEK